jgi:hypothetical protein
MNDTVDAETIRRLVDRQDIEDCIRRVSRGIDRHDVELMRSSFHADSRVDYGSKICSGWDFPGWANRLHDLGAKSHLHYLSPTVVEIDGDEAHAETYVMNAHVQSGGWQVVMGGGRYLDRLERRESVWKISDRICIVEWWSEPDTMAYLAPLIYPSSQGRDDPSYRRPLRADREFVDHTDPSKFF